MSQRHGRKFLARSEWKTACHFHDLTEREVLGEVSRRVQELKAKAQADNSPSRMMHPLVLLDLDSTLYEVGPRTFQILHEWMDTDESLGHPRIRHALQKLKESEVGYSLADTFQRVGLGLDLADAQHALEVLKSFWRARFFTSRYLVYDRPYPGAASFTRELFRLGAEIVYLTGRDDPGMGEGTRSNLIRDGFPWNVTGTHLLMKKASHIPDLEHKIQAADFIRGRGTLVASFENEPPNLIALSKIFPDAMHVFLDTLCSEDEAPTGKNLYRIRGFEGA